MTIYQKGIVKMENRNEEIALARDLHTAINMNELNLVYQPILNQKKEIVAIESLLRWNHPEQHFISPEKIIKIAEQSNLIGVLGEWILRESCKQLVEWHQSGYPSLQINVNFSPLQLLDDSLDSKVERILFETRLEARYLELEITENINIFELENIMDNLNRLKKIGVSIAVDDFGTGYSSLEYIHQLPVDRIKIDKCFIKGLNLNNEKTYAVVKTVLYLAEILNLEIIAEGVETDVQYQFLIDQSCRKFQGYFFYKPMNTEDIIEALKECNLNKIESVS